MTDYSLDLDRSQILFQPSPSSQKFEVCRIIEEDSVLPITFLVSDYLLHRIVCTAKTSPRLESRVRVSLHSQKMEQVQCFLLGRLSEN